MSDLGPEIRHSVFIRAPREKVWTALTTPEGMDGWWGTRGAEIDLRPGGKITLRWSDWGAEKDVDMNRDCIVVEVQAPERFVFRWGDPAGPTTTVEFALEERDGGTVLRVREHGFPDTAVGRKAFGANSVGWGQSAVLLKFYVEHGVQY